MISVLTDVLGEVLVDEVPNRPATHEIPRLRSSRLCLECCELAANPIRNDLQQATANLWINGSHAFQDRDEVVY